MALLLRMGGVPARVAAGFTPGTYDKKSGTLDRHRHRRPRLGRGLVPRSTGGCASIPTPTTAPARGGSRHRADPEEAAGRLDRRRRRPGAPRGRQRRGRRDDAAPWRRRRDEPVVADRTRHRADRAGWLGSCAASSAATSRAPICWPSSSVRWRAPGRPLHEGITLAALERRLHGSPDAEAYVRALRLSRYGGGAGTPNAAQRRALRRELGPRARVHRAHPRAVGAAAARVSRQALSGHGALF